MSTRVTMHRSESESIETLSPRREFTINGYELAQMAIRNRWLIMIAAVSVMMLTATVVFLMPNRYVSTATILPSVEGNSLSELRSLAGLAGIMPKDNNPSALFPTILGSRMMYDNLLARDLTYQVDGRSVSTSLAEYFGETNPDRLRDALAGVTSVSTDKKTGVISLGVETTSPSLSQGILTAYLTELEDYNLNRRQSQAKENALYLERQMTARTISLKAAEDSMEYFQSRNRDWTMSSDPEVGTIIGRLQREVEVNNTAYLFLRQQYEIAQLETQKDIPIVRVLDEPSLPTIKSGPRRISMIAAAGLVTMIFMTLLIFIVNRMRHRTRADLDYTALRDEISSVFPVTNRLASRLGRTVRPARTTS